MKTNMELPAKFHTKQFAIFFLVLTTVVVGLVEKRFQEVDACLTIRDEEVIDASVGFGRCVPQASPQQSTPPARYGRRFA